MAVRHDEDLLDRPGAGQAKDRQWDARDARLRDQGCSRLAEGSSNDLQMLQCLVDHESELPDSLRPGGVPEPVCREQRSTRSNGQGSGTLKRRGGLTCLVKDSTWLNDGLTTCRNNFSATIVTQQCSGQGFPLSAVDNQRDDGLESAGQLTVSCADACPTVT